MKDRNGTDGHMKGDYSYNGRRRPTMGTGMAERGAQAVEGYRGRMKKRMQRLQREKMGY